MPAVKATRRERALATRRRIVEAALELFLAGGYAVTMEAIATRAGVAVQTVYFVFRSKAALLQEVAAYLAAGEHGAPPVMERPWIAAAAQAESGEELLAILVDNGTDIFTRAAPLRPVLTAAAADPDLARYLQRLGRARHDGIRRALALADERGWLRAGLTLDRAADAMSAVHHPAVHEILVTECGWTPDEYKAWQRQVLAEQLLASSSK